MKILDLLKSVSVDIDAKCENKDQAIEHLIALIEKRDVLRDKEEYKKAIYAREELSTTGIGEGIAIPHAQSDAVTQPALAAMVVKNGVDYQSLDQQDAQLFFMIAVPKTGGNEHLQILAMLSKMLMDSEFKEKLIQASSQDEFMNLIVQKENEEKEKEKEKEEQSQENTQDEIYRVLAVTACPTGIAHTYMAAEALENKAKEMNVSLKVETNGSSGIQNALTPKEIEDCEAIIVAADRDVAMERFIGKPVLKVKVADGIHKPEELINEALSGQVPLYQKPTDEKVEKINENPKEIVKEEKKENVLYQMYMHLMNGVNHILPFVIGGGILLTLSTLFKDSSFQLQLMGVQMTFPVLCETVGNLILALVYPVLSGYIALSIADQPALFVGFVGGALVNHGDTGFLGACIAGFIAGYMMRGLIKLCRYIPSMFDGLKPVLIYPFVGSVVIALVMLFIVNPCVLPIHQFILHTLNSMNSLTKLFVGIVLGIMMAMDMGGPINKMAYVIGVATVMIGVYDIMAAVMIAGMIPPLSISLAMFMFKDCFEEKEHQSLVRNTIMGLSFITEGAIPFVQKDRKHILPACVIGSAVASGLSMVFGCTLRVPHGGIFVIGLITQPIRFCIALVLGTIVGMVIIGLMKKPIQ